MPRISGNLRACLARLLSRYSEFAEAVNGAYGLSGGEIPERTPGPDPAPLSFNWLVGSVARRSVCEKPDRFAVVEIYRWQGDKRAGKRTEPDVGLDPHGIP